MNTVWSNFVQGTRTLYYSRKLRFNLCCYRRDESCNRKGILCLYHPIENEDSQAPDNRPGAIQIL